ncbi:alpha/beta hydrolase [Arenibaculum pallidiluteum]|uniref:alpha/beta hydrolase n=1 Tax=Arenibaculum pallidiluteum TaxID=2812559 RepID=UPI001A96B80D|nr:alpha/beta hydrolase [Arenibaculum pallidiluteum]
MSTATPPEIPASLWAEMDALAPRWAADIPGHNRLVTERFGAILARAPKCAAVHRDIAYGPHPRQSFDLFLPDGGAAGRPVLVFVHGGGFTEGERNRTPEVHSNVLHCFARFGIVGANLGYRLAPEARFPDASLDIARGLDRIREVTRGLGADLARLYLMGHSAGAAHAASYAYDRRWHPAEGPGIAGLIVVSGRVRADNGPRNPNARRVEAYYGTDPALFDGASAVSHVGPGSVPTFVAFAEYENPLIDAHCLELAHRIAVEKGRAPELLRLRRHNHASIIAHLNTADDVLAAAIRTFMAATEPSTSAVR